MAVIKIEAEKSPFNPNYFRLKVKITDGTSIREIVEAMVKYGKEKIEKAYAHDGISVLIKSTGSNRYYPGMGLPKEYFDLYLKLQDSKNNNHEISESKEIKKKDELIERFTLNNDDEAWDYATLVAKAYLKAPKFDPAATKCWDSLLVSCKNFYKKTLSAIDIIYTDKEMYADAQAMKDDVKKNKRMYVSLEYTGHPYWSDTDYQIFRAVHDYIVHVLGNSDFTLRGEQRAANLHMRLVPNEAKPAVFLEITGKTSYYLTYGHFPISKIAILKGFDFNNFGKVEPDVIENVKPYTLKDDTKEQEDITDLNPGDVPNNYNPETKSLMQSTKNESSNQRVKDILNLLERKTEKGEIIKLEDDPCKHMTFTENLEEGEENYNTFNQEILKGYLVAALWTEEDEVGDASLADISSKSKQKAIQDINNFVLKAGDLIKKSGLDAEQIGHDLWLTRNGHGAGFWDRDLGDIGEKLSGIARNMGNINVFKGDNGEVLLESKITQLSSKELLDKTNNTESKKTKLKEGRYIDYSELMHIAKLAGNYVKDAKDALMDLGENYDDADIPMDSVQAILDEYDCGDILDDEQTPEDKQYGEDLDIENDSFNREQGLIESKNSVEESKVDLKGDKKKYYQMSLDMFLKAERRRVGKEALDNLRDKWVNEFYPKQVKNALDKGWYQEDIKNGRISDSEAAKIIKNAGFKVPKDIEQGGLTEAKRYKKQLNENQDIIVSKLEKLGFEFDNEDKYGNVNLFKRSKKGGGIHASINKDGTEINGMSPEKYIDDVKSGLLESAEIEPHKISVSKAVVIKELSAKYHLKPNEANLLYSSKNKDIEEEMDNATGGIKSIYDRLYNMGFITIGEQEDYGNNFFFAPYMLSEKGESFISAVDARIQSRKNIKSGVDLFPEDIAESKIMENDLSAENNLYQVVGKKNGQLVEISELPMSEDDCWKWIKDNGIEKYYTNPVPIPYYGNKKEFKSKKYESKMKIQKDKKQLNETSVTMMTPINFMRYEDDDVVAAIKEIFEKKDYSEFTLENIQGNTNIYNIQITYTSDDEDDDKNYEFRQSDIVQKIHKLRSKLFADISMKIPVVNLNIAAIQKTKDTTSNTVRFIIVMLTSSTNNRDWATGKKNSIVKEAKQPAASINESPEWKDVVELDVPDAFKVADEGKNIEGVKSVSVVTATRVRVAYDKRKISRENVINAIVDLPF